MPDSEKKKYPEETLLERVNRIRAKTPRVCGCAGCVTTNTLLDYIKELKRGQMDRDDANRSPEGAARTSGDAGGSG